MNFRFYWSFVAWLQTDIFSVEAVHLGHLYKIVIGHNGLGSGQKSLYLDTECYLWSYSPFPWNTICIFKIRYMNFFQKKDKYFLWNCLNDIVTLFKIFCFLFQYAFRLKSSVCNSSVILNKSSLKNWREVLLVILWRCSWRFWLQCLVIRLNNKSICLQSKYLFYKVLNLNIVKHSKVF